MSEKKYPQCEFAPYKDSDRESYHYLRTCKEWYGLHCPCDGNQNPCPHCNHVPVPEICPMDLDND
jgi:hypothetical protein